MGYKVKVVKARGKPFASHRYFLLFLLFFVHQLYGRHDQQYQNEKSGN